MSEAKPQDGTTVSHAVKRCDTVRFILFCEVRIEDKVINPVLERI